MEYALFYTDCVAPTRFVGQSVNLLETITVNSYQSINQLINGEVSQAARRLIFSVNFSAWQQVQ